MKQPVKGADELKLHYVAEFERTRGEGPEFGKQWGRAVKAFGELVAMRGLERAKRIVTTALQEDQRYMRRINPWEIAEDSNKHLAPRASAPVQQGSVQRKQTTVDPTLTSRAPAGAVARPERDADGARAGDRDDGGRYGGARR